MGKQEPPKEYGKIEDTEPMTRKRMGTADEEFLASLEGYLFQEGSSLSAAGINYNSLKMQRLIAHG